MKTFNTALNYFNKAYEIMSNEEGPIETLWNEIENIPDDELIEISAGRLKGFIRQHMALTSYIMNDMEGVRHYLEMKNLI